MIEINYLADFFAGSSPAMALGESSGPALAAEPGFGALLNQAPDGNI
jgi:hypothetical protein